MKVDTMPILGIYIWSVKHSTPLDPVLPMLICICVVHLCNLRRKSIRGWEWVLKWSCHFSSLMRVVCIKTQSYVTVSKIGIIREKQKKEGKTVKP